MSLNKKMMAMLALAGAMTILPAKGQVTAVAKESLQPKNDGCADS